MPCFDYWNAGPKALLGTPDPTRVEVVVRAIGWVIGGFVIVLSLSLLVGGEPPGFPIRADKGADKYDDVCGNHYKQRPKKDGVTHNFPLPLRKPAMCAVWLISS